MLKTMLKNRKWYSKQVRILSKGCVGQPETTDYLKQRYQIVAKKVSGKHAPVFQTDLEQRASFYCFGEKYFALHNVFYNPKVSQIKLADILEECMQNYPKFMHFFYMMKKCSKGNHMLRHYSPFILESIYLDGGI